MRIAIELEPFALSLVNSIDTMLAFLDQVGLPPGRGVTPIADYLAVIRDTGYDGVVSIELERIVEWVAEAKDATAAIMVSPGLPAGGCHSILIPSM